MAYYLKRYLNTPFLQNKAVLYASLIIVLLSILRHISNSNLNAVMLMALIGLVTSYFSKNMIIILLTSFATVFIFEMLGYRGVMEGMKGKKKESADTMNKTEKKDDTTSKVKPAALPASSEGTDKDEVDGKTKGKDKVRPAPETEPDDKPENAEGSDQNSGKSKKQGMSLLSPASYDGKNHDGDNEINDTPKGANRIDYASTLEQAYDNIENIIGEDGVRGLTDQTKSLMNQQKELMNSMKDMGPLLKSAEGFMKQITGDGGIKGVTEMLKGFVTPSSKK
jgi:hypothetical protein